MDPNSSRKLDFVRYDEQEMCRRAHDFYLRMAQRRNFGFQKVEVLDGNIGYLDLRGFASAEYGGPTATAAMAFLQNTDAMIIDLRKNGGGSPSMIQLLSSYFFAERTHLNSFNTRRTDTTDQRWTQVTTEGPRLADVPIWVLTSWRSSSGLLPSAASRIPSVRIGRDPASVRPSRPSATSAKR